MPAHMKRARDGDDAGDDARRLRGKMARADAGASGTGSRLVGHRNATLRINFAFPGPLGQIVVDPLHLKAERFLVLGIRATRGL